MCARIVLQMARRGRGGGGTGSRCEFHELHSVDGYTEYQSVYDSTWYVGFNRRGRRLSGRHWTRRRGARARRCRQFLKTNFARADVRPIISSDSSHRLPFDLRRAVDVLRTTTASAVTPGRPRRRKSRQHRRRRRQHQHYDQQQHQTVRTT